MMQFRSDLKTGRFCPVSDHVADSEEANRSRMEAARLEEVATRPREDRARSVMVRVAPEEDRAAAIMVPIAARMVPPEKKWRRFES